MPEDSRVGTSAANAVIDRSVWEMQCTLGMSCGVLRTSSQQVSKMRFGWEDNV